MALLTARNISLGYDSIPVAEGLNFHVDSGDYLAVVGENGSGKTTLIRTLLQLQNPLGGEIVLDDGLRKNEIGHLPQQTAIQKDFPASVREIVISGCQGRAGLRPFYTREEKELAEESMELMDISELAVKCYRELSGGQQQRVLLARALCAARKILLLDEPASGLDPSAAARMYDLIEKMNGKGIAIIMVSHDITAAVNYAKHILHIGDNIFYGTKEEYIKSEIGRAFIKEHRGGETA
ncbi:MAG: metal ABC transporter ATP-binding protein [Mogibacterium sp.]|nr:metal ABC transporter ATP-binding protein [Mogibacterium sp.]